MIDEAPIPPFERITESLNHAGSLSDPSEAHGLLCGLLCADNAIGSEVWLKQIMSSAAEGRVLAREDRDTLLGLFASTSQQLDEPGLGFTLLLPDDETPLSVRADLLGHWCQGFMFGLGLGGVQGGPKTPDEVREFLDDLSAISQAGFDADEAGDEDELAYTEIIEYVRIGVLLVNEILQPHSAPTRPPRLH